jgi:hypothetical protein
VENDRQVLEDVEEAGSIPCANMSLGLAAYRGQL